MRARKLFTLGRKVAKSKAGQKITEAVKATVLNEAREVLADKPIGALVKDADKIGVTVKTVIGALGMNLLPPSDRSVSINDSANGGITTSCSLYQYRPARKTPLGVRYTQLERSAYTANVSANFQGVYDFNICDAEPVNGNPGSASNWSHCTVRKAFDDFILASNQAPGSTSLVNIEQMSCHFTTLTSEFTVRNTNSTPAQVDIYELVPKHALGPTNYDDQVIATGYMSPTWAFKAGLASDTPMLNDPLSYQTYGAKPYDSLNFSRTWKEVKRVRINLTGGASHIHKSVYKINKTVSYQEMAQFSTSGGKFAGWNPVYLVVVKGLPSATATLGDACQVEFSNLIRLDYIGSMSQGTKAIVFENAI
jgi:hypothetical protein